MFQYLKNILKTLGILKLYINYSFIQQILTKQLLRLIWGTIFDIGDTYSLKQNKTWSLCSWGLQMRWC